MRSMQPNLSSLNSPFHSLPISLQLSSFLKQPPSAAAPRPRPAFYVHVSNSCNEKPRESHRIGDPTPPWLVQPPPAPPREPTSGEEALFGFRAQGSRFGGLPLSLRLLQLKKKMMNKSRRAQPADLGAVGNAVSSLASAMEEVQRAVLTGDTADSVVWLFRNVYCDSPGLLIDLLVLSANFLSAAVEREVPPPPIAVERYKCWSDIGILEEFKEIERCGSEPLADYKRRAVAYEKMITSGMTSSMILTNYAQLLYQYEKDIDRQLIKFTY
ncbi:hypothetical protein Cni_G14583 [Canna indica]|uniref:Uncharacterized protein n=1 Tax=Canna indica TaxID=4628 RepID=A0AAQ3KGK7_9LILI|nr:hypothetical protein Cni_G14583 [Canna indica]